MGPACVPRECEEVSDHPPMSSCDGNTAVGKHWDCLDYTTARTDCSDQGQVCSEGRCWTPCSTDADCGPSDYCSHALRSFDGRAVCVPLLTEGFKCDPTTKCAPGLVCGPYTPFSDAGAPDSGPLDATSEGAADSGAASNPPVLTICQPDCSGVDPATMTCPVGAPSVCVGAAIMKCRCRVPTTIESTCDAAQTCFLVPSSGGGFCALSSTPDPKCAASGAYEGLPDGYCTDTGDAIVTCSSGYATGRKACPPGQRCRSGIPGEPTCGV
jgi:hypothetical protein